MDNLTVNASVGFGKRGVQSSMQENQKTNLKRNLTIGTAVLGTATAITAGVIYRKNISKWISNLLNKFKTIFATHTKPLTPMKPATVFDSTAEYSKETKKLINNEIVNMFSNETIAANQASRAKELKTMRMDAIKAFKNMNVEA